MARPENTAKALAMLNQVIDELIAHVEQLGCTCVPEDYAARHTAPGRRRQDSRCTGVSLAVSAELRRRRANSLARRRL